MARKSAEFFSRHLLNKTYTPPADVAKAHKQSRMRCTKSGQVRGEIPGALTPHDENAARLTALEARLSALPDGERKSNALGWIKEKAFCARTVTQMNHRYLVNDHHYDLLYDSLLWFPQENVANYGIIFRHFTCAGKKLPVTVALWAGGTSALEGRADWLRETCESGRAVFVVDVSGTGNIRPNCMTTSRGVDGEWLAVQNHLTHQFYWVDDSLAAMRVFDAVRAAELLNDLDGIDAGETELYVCGRAASFGVMAAAICPAYKKIRLGEPAYAFSKMVRSRHYDTYDAMQSFIPGMLARFDVPDLVRWMEDEGRA